METEDRQDQRLIATDEADTPIFDESDDPWLEAEGHVPSVMNDMTSAQDATEGTTRSGHDVGGMNRTAGPRTSEQRAAFSGKSLVGDPATLRRQWESVQVGFVDDPRRAVEDSGGPGLNGCGGARGQLPAATPGAGGVLVGGLRSFHQ